MGLLILYLNFTLVQTYSNQGLRYKLTEGNKIITIDFFGNAQFHYFTNNYSTVRMKCKTKPVKIYICL